MQSQHRWRQGLSAIAPLVRIGSIGARAAQLLDQHADWTVAATFDRSFYIRCGDEFICIGDERIGNGPLNALLAAGSRLPQLEIGVPLNLDLSTAKIWKADPWPKISAEALHVDRLEAVIAAALDAAPEASFVHALSCKPSDDPLARRAIEGMTTLGNALRDPTVETCEAAAQRLLGLGHGLTPSGDDVLSGALIMLRALNRTETATTLTAAIRRHMDTATSPLSCAFLRAACDGQPSAALNRSITTLLSNGTSDDVIAPIRGIGHASGFDLLAGALATIQPI